VQYTTIVQGVCEQREKRAGKDNKAKERGSKESSADERNTGETKGVVLQSANR